MERIGVFEEELNLIHDEELRNYTREYLETYVPDYFYTCGASSSGKYHPKFSQGEGGLVRHTKAVVKFAIELMKLDMLKIAGNFFLQDIVIVACLIHDTGKYGLNSEMDKESYRTHAKNAEINFSAPYYRKYGELPNLGIRRAVLSHMGQWEENEEYRSYLYNNEHSSEEVCRLVHLADYIASRNFIDIPELNTIDT